MRIEMMSKMGNKTEEATEKKKRRDEETEKQWGNKRKQEQACEGFCMVTLGWLSYGLAIGCEPHIQARTSQTAHNTKRHQPIRN